MRDSVRDFGFDGLLNVDEVRLSATDLVEDSISTIHGKVSVVDPDHGEAAIQAASGASINGYGTFTVDAAGDWTYVLDNTNSTVNALGTGNLLTDSFVLHSVDGTAKTMIKKFFDKLAAEAAT